MKTTKEYISLISSHADELKRYSALSRCLSSALYLVTSNTKEAMWMFVWIWNQNPIWLFA